MIYTTLRRIRARKPCRDGWAKLLAHLGKNKADDEPLPMVEILEGNGIEDALWCLQAEPQHSAIWRMLAVHYARKVQHLMTDPRSLAALDVSWRYAHGEATDQELAAARAAAWAAAARAAASAVAARDAASAVAARDAARAAASAVAARAAASAVAARDAAWAAARAEQATDLRVVLTHYDALPGEQITGWRGMKDGAA